MRREVKTWGREGLLWLHGGGFRVIAPGGRSRVIDLTEELEEEIEVTFGEGEESLYLLKTSLNRLHNLTSLTLDYRTRIAAYEPDFVVKHTHHQSVLKVPHDPKALIDNGSISVSEEGRFLYLLDDLPEEYKHYTVTKGDE